MRQIISLSSRSTSFLAHSALRLASLPAAKNGGNWRGAASTTTATSSSSSPIRWGILSAGKIASDFCQALQAAPEAEAAAIAARSLTKAQEFGTRHGIAKSYGNYDDLLADQNIDVVYVGSIADHHADLAERSIRAGKAVVVEKPLSLSYETTKRLTDLAADRKVFLMEGMWTRCFPAMRKVKELLPKIGSVSTVQADFGWSTAECKPEDRIWNPASGGMTMDVGMYLAQLGQVAFPGEPVEDVQAMGTTMNGVDHTVLTNVRYGSGFLQFYVTGTANTEERVVIQGELGRIVIDPPAHVPSRVRLVLDKGRGSTTETVYDHPLPIDTGYAWNYPGSIGFVYEIKAVGDALQKRLLECPDFTWNDSLQVASVLDQIRDQVSDENIKNTESLATG